MVQFAVMNKSQFKQERNLSGDKFLRTRNLSADIAQFSNDTWLCLTRSSCEVLTVILLGHDNVCKHNNGKFGAAYINESQERPSV